MKIRILLIAALAATGFLLPAQNLVLKYKICNNCNAQENSDTGYGYTYGQPIGYQSQDITSDFGPRVSPYDWHKGVDFRPLRYAGQDDAGRGTAIMALVSGTVHNIKGSYGYKHITIDGTTQDFGYSHIFNYDHGGNGLQSGMYVLKALDGYPDRYAIIDLTTINNARADRIAIGSLYNLPNGGTVTFDNVVFDVREQVAADQVIASMGGSGIPLNNAPNNDRYPCHLHLYHYHTLGNPLNVSHQEPYPTNCLDPLKEVHHYNTSYKLKFLTQGQAFGNTSIKYPGTVATKFKARAFMDEAKFPLPPNVGTIIGEMGSSARIRDAVMNIDYVQMQLKRQGAADWEMIRGATFRSEVKLGAFDDNLTYPTTIITGMGSFNKQGIRPFAYDTRPYDEFYFTDFIPRIHRADPMDGAANGIMIAGCPMDARYNDGAYKLKAQLKTVRATSAYEDSPIQNFTLDNFQPFVQSVRVTLGVREIYNMSWECGADGCIAPTGGVNALQRPISEVELSTSMRVVVTCSEPMITFDMGVILAGEQLTLGTPQISPDRKTFTWVIQGFALSTALNNGGQANGNDFQLSFTGRDYSPQGGTPLPGQTVPGNRLLNLAAHYHPDNPTINTTCIKVPTRTGLNTASDWANPNNLPNGTEVAHHFGFNCGDTGGRGFEDGNVPIQCCPEITSMDTNIQPDCGSNNGSISIIVETDSPDTEVGITWSHGGLTGNTITNLAAGVYTVTIRTNEDCVITEDITVPGSSADWSADIRVDRTVGCMCDATPIQAFEVTYPDNQGPFYFQWTGPGGYTSTEQNPVDISVADQYYILTVTNDAGCSRVYNNYNMYLPACPAFNPPIEFEVFPDCGGAGGIVTANVPGWNPSQLIYQWSNGQEIPTIRNVPAGRYNVTITNTHGCSITGRVEVPDMTDTPTFITLNSTVTPACAPNTGSIALDLTDITPPHNVRWSFSEETGSTLSFLNSGQYIVTVTDGNGCSVTESFIVDAGPMVRADVVPASCVDNADGSISLNITGSSNNTIVWDDGNQYQNQTVRDNLRPDVYCVTVTSSQGCEVQQCYDLRPTEPNTFAPYLQRVDVYAEPGGQHIYSGHWRPTSDGCVVFDGGVQAISPQLIQAMAAPAPGNSISWRVEMVFSEDVQGVVIEYNGNAGVAGNSLADDISQGIAHTFTIPATSVSTMAATGLISIGFKVSGFDTEDMPNHILDMLTLSNNLTGCVKIPYYDPFDCKWRPEWVENADKTHHIEFKCMSAEIVAMGTDMFCLDLGGTPITDIASIKWKRPDGTTSTGLNPCLTLVLNAFGTYCVTITMDSGCEVNLCAVYCERPTVNGPHVTITKPDCPGGTGGSICLDVSASKPLSFTWSNGQNGTCIEDLPAGEYSVTITVASGCELTQGMPLVLPFEIEADGAPLEFVSQIAPSCPNEASGVACIWPEGGTAPYTIAWKDGFIGNCRFDLEAGTHQFNIVDACGTTLEAEVEILERSIDEVEVSIIPPAPDACPTSLELRVGTNGVTVAIRHNTTGASFTQVSNGGLLIFRNIPPGEYTITITDFCGSQNTITHEVLEQRVSLIGGIRHHGFIACEGQTGMLTATLTGNGVAPYSFLWSNGATTQHIDNLETGFYNVTVTDAVGCSDSHQGLMLDVRDADPMVIAADVKPYCSPSSPGSITVNVSDAASPYTYQWTDGRTTRTITNLSPGQYCVTVTDANGCLGKNCFTVEQYVAADVVADIKDNDCTTFQCDGSIELELSNSNPRTFQWNTGATTQNIRQLCPGEYTVTITEGGCSQIHVFNVASNQASTAWEFTYDITAGFYVTTNGNAEVRIYSELFGSTITSLLGQIAVFADPGYLSPITTGFFIGGSSLHNRIIINKSFASLNRFYLRYTSLSGCVYTGDIIIPDCRIDDPVGISFDIEHVGDDRKECAPGQSNTYLIHITEIGNQFPYMIDIKTHARHLPTLSTAMYPEGDGFLKRVIIEDGNFENPIEVTGVPAGTIYFNGILPCPVSPGQTIPTEKKHRNCCFDGDLESTTTVSSEWGSGPRFNYEYFQIRFSEECWDSNCYTSGDQQPCTIVHILYGGTISSFDCWTGRIRIDYPETDDDLELEVRPHPNGNVTNTHYITGSDTWHPSGRGTFTINITYEGTGASEGQDYTTTQEITVYGDELGLNDDVLGDIIGFGPYPFNASWLNFPPSFNNAYAQFWLCNVCGPSDYIYGGEVGDGCTNQDNWFSDYFEYYPTDYGNPCDGGGKVIIMKLDDNGTGRLTEVTIPAGKMLDEKRTHYPLITAGQNVACETAGYCLFNSIDVYGFEFDDGRPILTSWADPNSCASIPLPSLPSSTPTTPCSPENCLEPYTCVNGDCLAPCENNSNNPCLEGTCINGYCVVEEPCGGGCPEGQVCNDEGQCVQRAGCTRGLITSRLRCGPTNNPCSFTHDFGGPAVLRFEFLTYAHADKLQVRVDDVLHDFPCVQTGGTGGTGWVEYEINVDGEVEIEVRVLSGGDCEATQADDYDWHAWCGTNRFQEGDPDQLVEGGNRMMGMDDIVIYPNPFEQDFNLLVNNWDEPYHGMVKLLNVLGMEEVSLNHYFISGENALTLNGMGRLNRGLYTVVVFGESGILHSKKILKL